MEAVITQLTSFLVQGNERKGKPRIQFQMDPKYVYTKDHAEKSFDFALAMVSMQILIIVHKYTYVFLEIYRIKLFLFLNIFVISAQKDWLGKICQKGWLKYGYTNVQNSCNYKKL